jgi:hypothetical protein
VKYILFYIWAKCNNIRYDIWSKTFRFNSSDKSVRFVPKVSKDICIEILIFVKSERTEKKALDISSDIWDKSETFKFFCADKWNKFVPKVSNGICIKYSSLSDLKDHTNYLLSLIFYIFCFFSVQKSSHGGQRGYTHTNMLNFLKLFILKQNGPKMWNNYLYVVNMLFFQYWDRNIGLFFISHRKINALLCDSKSCCS